MRTAAAGMFLALIWTSASAAGECPTFTGREWEFTGHLVNRIYPGPPNYKSVTSGDKPVTRMVPASFHGQLVSQSTEV